MAKKNDNNLEIFTIWSDEIESRLDPYFYQGYFRELEKELKNCKFSLSKLEDICSAIRGVTYSADDEVEEGLKILRANNITLATNELNFDDVRNIKADFPVSEEQRLKKGDILMSAASGSKEHVGKVAYIAEDTEYYFGSFMMVLRANEKVNPQYLFEFLSSKIFRGLLFRILGGTNINNLNFSMIKDFEIPLPSLEIQKKIAETASKNREKAKELELQARKMVAEVDSFVLGELGIEMPEGGAERVYSVWSDLLLGGRLDAEYYNPFYDLFYKKLSDGKYQLTMIEDVATDVFQGVGKKETENPEFTLLKVKNIKKNNEIDFEDTEFVESVPEDKVLQNGDILSPFIGEAVRQCKFSVFENGEKKFAVDNNTGVIRIDNTKENSEYVAYALNSQIGNMQLKHLIGGGGVPFLGSENARKLKIPLPPVAIQKKIVDKIKEQHNKARNLRQEAESVIAEAQKQTAEMIFA